MVTSALTLTPNPPNEDDVEEDVSEEGELCFETTSPAPVDPVAPSTAPGAFAINGASNFVVDYNTTVVPLQWNRPTNVGVQGTDGDPLYYEYLQARDEDNNDFLLVKTVNDNPDATLQGTSWTVCSGQFGPILCENPTMPFSGDEHGVPPHPRVQ